MGQRNFLFAITFAALTAPTSALALPPGFAPLADAVLASSYPSDGPGASVVISQHGKVVYRGTRGLADVATKQPITPKTVFRLGSITKQFAAAVVLQLAAQGKLDLADPLSTYLPDYPNGRSIKISQLLNHTSGVQSYTEIPGWMVESNTCRPHTTQQLIAVFKDLPAPSKPGEVWAYNNSGYILVGALIEVVTHKPWYEAIEERIVRPLKLTTIRYGTYEPGIATMAKGYSKADNAITPSTKIDMSVPGAAGALVGTPSDLAKWADALHHGRVVTAPYYARMISPTKLLDGSTLPYAFGLENDDVRGHPAIGHSGGIFGFTSDSLYLPQDDIFVAVFSNSDDPQTSVGTTTRRLAAAAIASPFPTFTAIPLDNRKIDSMLGVYKFNDTERVFGMRDGKLYTKRSGGPETAVMYAGGELFFYGPDKLDWFAVREISPGEFVFERHPSGAERIDLGLRMGSPPSGK